MKASAMSRTLGAVLMAVLVMPIVAAPPAAATTRVSFTAELQATDIVMPDPGPGSDWISHDVWHVRGAQVTDAVHGDLVGGTLERTVLFNLDLESGRSNAWCSFEWTGEVDTWTGSCRGSLTAGTFNGRGAGGTLLHGTYALAPGGIPAVGPYVVSGDILRPGS
jgi:hypothetical protein